MFTVYQVSFLAKDELCAINQWGISQFTYDKNTKDKNARVIICQSKCVRIIH